MMRWTGGTRRRMCVLVIIYILAWLPAVLATNAAPRDAARAELQSAFTVYVPVVMQPLIQGARFSSGSPIAVSPDGATLWVVNPDAGSVSLVDAVALATVAEVPVGGEPWSLAVSHDGSSVYVVDRAGGALVVIDAARRSVRARLLVGPEPAQIALSPDDATAYVSVSAADRVVAIDTAKLLIQARIGVAPRPYAIAAGTVTGAPRLYITHLLAQPRPGGSEATDDGREGRVTVLDPSSNTVVAQIAMPPDTHGFPNLLSSIAVAGQRAWIPTVRAAPDLPNGLTTTVFAAVSTLDLVGNQEDVGARVALNDIETFGSPVNDPVAALPAPDGKTLYVVLAGSNLVEVVDLTRPTQPRLVKFLPAGRDPRGMALSPDGRWGYVMSYLSRAVTVLDLQQFAVVATLPVVGETLAADVLRGKILFNTAGDPRLAQGSWISCASCHIDGGSDGVTWMFPDGIRQTPPLWNATQTLPWHWSAALDEPQDVEFTNRQIQHGIGLLPGVQPPLLGAPVSGQSVDLDALVAFLTRGIRTPTVSAPASGVAHGRLLFVAAGCATCHGGPNWTSSALPGQPGTLDPDGNGMVDSVLHAVGTLNARDRRGATGFDSPSLLDVGLTAPYFHDGSMPTLETLLVSGHPDPHGQGNGLSKQDIADLVLFLESIGPNTPTVTNP